MTDPDIPLLRVLFAFAVVAGLLAALGFALRYLKMRGFALPAAGGGRARRMRLIESLPLDPRRRLVIVRRDDAEHLLLLGLNQDIVVETNLDQSDKLRTKGNL